MFTQRKRSPVLSVAGLPLLALDAALLPLRAYLWVKHHDGSFGKGGEQHHQDAVNSEYGRLDQNAPDQAAKPSKTKVKRDRVMCDGWRWQPRGTVRQNRSTRSRASRESQSIHHGSEPQRRKTSRTLCDCGDYSYLTTRTALSRASTHRTERSRKPAPKFRQGLCHSKASAQGNKSAGHNSGGRLDARKSRKSGTTMLAAVRLTPTQHPCSMDSEDLATFPGLSAGVQFDVLAEEEKRLRWLRPAVEARLGHQ